MDTDAGDVARLTLSEARAIIDRCLEKAAELKCKGTFVIVDAGGNVVSISRMEGSPPTGVGISRAKAYASAVTQEPTLSFARRMHARPVWYSGYQDILPGKIFAGPGGLPIRKNGAVVGGIATGPGIGPVTRVEGVDPSKFVVDGQQANAEDLIIAYGLQIPYTNQHEDLEVKR